MYAIETLLGIVVLYLSAQVLSVWLQHHGCLFVLQAFSLYLQVQVFFLVVLRGTYGFKTFRLNLCLLKDCGCCLLCQRFVQLMI